MLFLGTDFRFWSWLGLTRNGDVKSRVLAGPILIPPLSTFALFLVLLFSNQPSRAIFFPIIQKRWHRVSNLWPHGLINDGLDHRTQCQGQLCLQHGTYHQLFGMAAMPFPWNDIVSQSLNLILGIYRSPSE